MERVKLATVWLGGCSGCHMSFLDLDEWLIELNTLAQLVFSPIADVKTFPAGVDVALVEGAVANEDHLQLIREVRERSRLLVSFGDCAVTGNVTALRNPLGAPEPVLQQIYGAAAARQAEAEVMPALTGRVLPLHAVVHVDAYLPGCPPSAARIRAAIEHLLGRTAPVGAQGEPISFG